MMEVTATMFPATVKRDRSLLDQVASRAIQMASRKVLIFGFLHFHRIAVVELPHCTERPDDDFVPRF